MAIAIASKVHSAMGQEESISGYLADYYQQKEESTRQQQQLALTKILPGEDPSMPVEIKFLDRRTSTWRQEVYQTDWSGPLRKLELEMEVNEKNVFKKIVG